MDESKAMFPCQIRSESSPPDIKAMSLSVFFNGWRKVNSAFKSWAIKMSSLHKPTWQKAGIFEAVMVSTKEIAKNTDLLLGISERWCPDTKTFLFPWGEATVTLEDVMVILGFSVLGSPFFAALDSSGEKTVRELGREWVKIKKDNKVTFVTQITWMGRFMNSGDDELEHAAFLALWLSYFVFPSRYYHIDKSILRIAVHLSSGTRIALAPPVLAHLYADLTLLKDHIRGFNIAKITPKLELSALFKLVQVWTWERFRELRPTQTNTLLKGEPRLALWDGWERGRAKRNARKILANSKMDSFEWRPYTKAVKNWTFPRFYPEKPMWVQVDENLDEELISFARCIKVSELVGIHSVEHYFPNRVASQFGLLQVVPCPVNRSNLFKEDAWDEYNKPIDGLTLYIPSRSEVAESLKPINIIGGDDDDDTSEHVPFGSKKRKSMKPTPLVLRNKNKAMCSSDENHNPPKVVPLVEVLQHLGKEFPEKLKRSRYLRTPTSVRSEIADSGGPASREVPLNELFQKEVVKRKSEHLEEKRACMDCYDNITTAEMVIDREDNEAGRTLVLSPSDGNNLSSPPVGFDGETDIAVSPPETMPTCDDEMNVHGSNADESTMMDDGSTAPYCLLNEAGILARDDGEETEPRVEENNEGRSEAGEINIQIPSDGNNSSAPPLAYEDANEDQGRQAHKSMGLSSVDKSSTHVNVGDQTQENGQGSEDTVKSQEELEDIGTRDDEGGVGNDSIKQSLLSIEEMAKDIEERITKTQKRVAWLKAMKSMKQRKVTSARLI